jgi:iron complex transport system substrate-binding protein
MRSRFIAVVILLGALVPASFGREIVDMAGRHVQLPEKITRLYVPSPFGAYMMYALAPELMTGRVFSPRQGDEKFLPPSLRQLPVLGVMMMGMGMSANPESILKSQPQVLVIWNLDRSPMDEKINSSLEKLNVPYVIVYGNGMAEYPAAIRFLGKLTGRTERAELLAKASEKILADVGTAVGKVPAAQRPKVYYAEGPDGLATECDDSFHTEMLKVVGDLNVHRCHTSGHMGMEKISLEQVILYRPDVIITQNKMFYDGVLKNPAWQQVKAVQAGKVYLVPRAPLNWFDRPPSMMRFLGVQWLTNILYPQQYPLNINKTTKDFCHLFLGVALSDDDVRSILQQQ